MTLGFHFTHVRMAKIKITSDNSCWRGCRLRRTLLHGWWEWKLVLKEFSILPQGHLHNYVHSSLIHTSQNLETTKMSFNQRIDKEDEVHLHNGVLLSYLKQ